MKASKTFCKIASWSLILVGIGHTITYLSSPKTSSQNDFITKMKGFPIEILGTETNIFLFHQGFSLMMGLLLFGYGLLNLLIMRNDQALNIPTNILILNSTISLVCFILSFAYFFIIPIVMTGIAFLGFSVSLISKLKK